MSGQFMPFQLFASATEAQPLLTALKSRGIEAETSVDAGRLAFDPSFAFQQQFTNFVVKLHPTDFERARQLQEQVNEQLLSELPPDHYLYGFSDAELFDILARPDEWSSLDVTLARVLLQRRGRAVSSEQLAQLRQQRAAELARPEASHPGWLVAGYVLALLGGLFGVLIGAQLYFHRRDLPTGRRAYAYSARVRVHGLRIMVLGVLMFGLGLYLELAG